MMSSQTRSSKDLPEFGRRLLAHREAAGISRSKLSDIVSVSPQHIWRLENGFRGCSRDLTIIISSRLNLTIEQINVLLLLAGHRPVVKRGDNQRTGLHQTYNEGVE